MNTPFFDAMAALAARGPRFFVPGHKGNPAAIPAFGPLLRHDLTEIEGADDLSCPAGPLAQSQRNMARAYGSGATLYSASGSTSCLQALLALFVGAGGGVVMARGCHVAAVRALAFLDITPRWVPCVQGRPQPAAVARALAESGYKAVYLTSPDYYGRMADIPAIAAVCRQHGAALLVDNAHGAHLRFLPRDIHPLSLGADGTADSAHKTLPCLTPAALLHLRDGARADAARAALNLFSSTSPSYLVLESLDLAAGMLLDGPPDFGAAAQQLAGTAAAFPALAGVADDPLRLLLHPARAGLAYETVLDALRAAGMAPEYADGERVVLMASPWNTADDFAALQRVLAQLATRPAEHAPQGGGWMPPETDERDLPQVACSIRQALFAPRETLPLDGAGGRVMAGLAAPCPPGVPVVLPGERIGPAEVAQLAAGGILSVDVVK